MVDCGHSTGYVHDSWARIFLWRIGSSKICAYNHDAGLTCPDSCLTLTISSDKFLCAKVFHFSRGCRSYLVSHWIFFGLRRNQPKCNWKSGIISSFLEPGSVHWLWLSDGYHGHSNDTRLAVCRISNDVCNHFASSYYRSLCRPISVRSVLDFH